MGSAFYRDRSPSTANVLRLLQENAIAFRRALARQRSSQEYPARKLQSLFSLLQKRPETDDSFHPCLFAHRFQHLRRNIVIWMSRYSHFTRFRRMNPLLMAAFLALKPPSFVPQIAREFSVFHRSQPPNRSVGHFRGGACLPRKGVPESQMPGSSISISCPTTVPTP